jgi:HAD superfamily hydrolase (TIGR01509 family)
MAIDTQLVKVICFDVDGTLRDTDDQMVQRFSELLQFLRFFNPDWEIEKTARRLVMGLEDPGNILYSIPDRLGFDDHLSRLNNALPRLGHGQKTKKHLLIDGVERMLKQLYPIYPLTIVTARGQRSTLDFLDHFGLSHYFRVIVTAQTCRHTKPYPDPLFFVAEQLGVSPADCLMVGDTTVDIRAGKAAGAQTIGVLCGFGEPDELSKLGADMLLPSTADLLSVF